MPITYVNISSINPSPYNPRTHTQQELQAVKNSLKEFGFVEPLIINKKTKNLVGGHLRLKAAKELGLKKVPVFKVNLDETKEKTLNIVLNSHTVQGSFEENLLSSLLEEIKIEIPDFYTDFDFEKLAKDLKIDFNELDIEKPEKEKFEFIECPNCKEMFEKKQAKKTK
jgi:hypothetical protein